MRVLAALGWMVVYLVVAPMTALLVTAHVVSDRDPERGVGFSPRMALRVLAIFYRPCVAPFLVGIAGITVVIVAFVPWFRSASAPALAGLACVVAAIVVVLGWAIHYSDQRQRLVRSLRRLATHRRFRSWLHGG